MAKVSDSLENGLFGAIGANGVLEWRLWHHLIHSMAILSSQSPFRLSGSFGDPIALIDPMAPLTKIATMAIHLRQWHQLLNCANGCNDTNGANSNNLVTIATMDV